MYIKELDCNVVEAAERRVYEAFQKNKTIAMSFSGGKDSSLLLDMYCEIVSTTPYIDKPICVSFADTTNETSAMMKFVKDFIEYEEKKMGSNHRFYRGASS